jgi:ABC-type nitrate/sulfonate/bicarbonate transport system ATPase subunit
MAEPDFLVFDHVTKRFPADGGEVEVVREADLTIARGEIVVFLGPSGCGKTTLMRMAGGLDFPTSGAVRIAGVPVTGPDRHKGMVFQQYSSFPWLTVFENVRFGMRYRRDLDAAAKRQRAERYVDLVDLAPFRDFYTNRISGGMRQRVAIARTLAADPDVLLMDEPFGALDAQTREFLQLQLLQINADEHKTIVFVTHDVEEAVLLANRIFVFSARPARVVATIDVTARLGREERTLETKESGRFFTLRNEILHVTRAEARRSEQLRAEEVRR